MSLAGINEKMRASNITNAARKNSVIVIFEHSDVILTGRLLSFQMLLETNLYDPSGQNRRKSSL